MGMLKLSCIQIAIALLFFTQHTKSSIDTPPHPNNSIKRCIASERTALLSFRAGLSDPSDLLSSWKGDDCCQWKGVQCSNRTGNVVALDLPGSDCYHDDVSAGVLGGNINFSLIGLQHLRFLDLSCNRFNMVQIPEFLGSLHSLRYLDLSDSSFVGRIPSQLGNLSNLRYLNLNSYLGNTYSTDITRLSQLTFLEHLEMSSVNLSTVTNWVSVLNILPSLKVLLLYGCQLSTSPDSLPHSNLTSLETLSIEGNSFHKPITPNWFWDSTRLKKLIISSNKFYGPFPYEIGNMTSMVYLDLSDNNLVGMIPTNMKSLCNLEELWLMGNNVNGSVTEFFNRLPSCSWQKFRALYLSNNSLTGNLPTRLEPSLMNLIELDLGVNKLTGHVPLWVGKLTKLRLLSLYSNNLDGVIHEGHLSGLVSLEFLFLTDNSFAIKLNSTWVPPWNLSLLELGSCFLGPKFPIWLKTQTFLSILDISNTSISDIVPDWFWIMASTVDTLNMRNNRISGFLPSTMEFMSASIIDLSSNQFSGTIPKLPVNLIGLDLSRNKLYGPLPLDFGAPGLETLILYENSISGTIPPSLCKLRRLKLLDLSANNLSGSIPDCRENFNINISSLSIHTLSLKNNNLSGEFPVFLQNCQQLISLDLSYNLFSGTLPTWIGENLPSLAFLRLRYNMFYGRIPIELTNLVKLQYLDLAYNKLSGSIPKSFNRCMGMTLTGDKAGEFKNVIHAEVSIDTDKMIDYTEYFMVVTKGQERQYTREIIYMVNLDLSCNNLTGEIPEEVGTLVALKNLNLSWNGFIGKIPANIGSLVQVESLDVSHNELSGEIPTSLSVLKYLSHLNLSYNNLVGKIPSGDQLQVLGNQESMYIGNLGLCGPPLSNKCPEAGLIPTAANDHEDASDMVFYFVSMGSGYITGLWVVFFAFLFWTKWRTFCFSLYDSLYDWIMCQ
ncbi:hypothetical protein ACP70R_037247 [Stipagrostis hirtigluma subsp. patula]